MIKNCIPGYLYNELFNESHRGKSHTCEEGGAHLRISIWHLLMNLKNSYFLRKLLKWTNRKQNDFSIYNDAFLLKKYRKTPVDIIIKNLMI